MKQLWDQQNISFAHLTSKIRGKCARKEPGSKKDTLEQRGTSAQARSESKRRKNVSTLI